MMWISIKDKFPMDNDTIVICWVQNKFVHRIQIAKFIKNKFTYCDSTTKKYLPYITPDYWMPLPELPKE